MMKKAILLFLIICATIGAKAQDEPKLPPDIDMLKFFYTYYMLPYVDGSKPTELFNKQSQMRKMYCTPRAQEQYWQLMQKMEDESDAFIKAPLADKNAIRSLQIDKVPNQPGRYKVSYQLGEFGDITSIELALIKDKEGEWKIDYLY